MPPRATSIATLPRLRQRYEQQVLPVLRREFGYRNIHAVPRLAQVTVSCGLGQGAANPKLIEVATSTLARITGQRPALRRARKSIASFKVRQGMPVGLVVTLRGRRLYEFLDKLINVSLPRVRDFRGISRSSFDRRGNLTIGFHEHVVFPEIKSDEVETLHGLEVTIGTTAARDAEARRLLELLGLPFSKET